MTTQTAIAADHSYRVIVRWNELVKETRPDGVFKFVDRFVIELPFKDCKTRDEAVQIQNNLNAWRGNRGIGKRNFDLRTQKFVDAVNGRMIQTLDVAVTTDEARELTSARGRHGFFSIDPDQSDVVVVYAEARIEKIHDRN